MMFTETELGSYMRLARLPRGPTLTFKLHNVSTCLILIKSYGSFARIESELNVAFYTGIMYLHNALNCDGCGI